MSDLNPTEPGSPPPAPPPMQEGNAPLSIWRDMWLKPRAVLRQEQNRPAHWRHWSPAMLAGIAAVLEAIGQTPPPGVTLPTLSPQTLLTAALLLGPLFGLLHVGLMGFLLRSLGKLWGGDVAPDAMRRGVSLSLVPLASSLILVLLELGWLRQPGHETLLLISVSLRVGLNLWTLLLLVMSVSELQRLPLLRALATVAGAIALVLTLLQLLQPG